MNMIEHLKMRLSMAQAERRAAESKLANIEKAEIQLRETNYIDPLTGLRITGFVEARKKASERMNQAKEAEVFLQYLIDRAEGSS